MELTTNTPPVWQYYSDQEELTPAKYHKKHPRIQYVQGFNMYTGFATYKSQQVHWSEQRNTWIYTNNHLVNFEEDEVASSLLSGAPETPERPTSPPRATSSRWPDPVTPTPERQFQTLATILEMPARQATAPGLPTPVTQRPVTPQQRTLTPPPRPVTLSWHVTQRITTMATTNPGTTQSKDRILGAAPELFDGKAENAESFWNTLKNYYYLNDVFFPDEERKEAE